MKKILLFIIWFLFISNSYALSVSDVFVDIDENYEYINELQYLYDNWVIKDSPDWYFSPDSLIRRSDFVWVVSEVSCKKCIQPSPSPDLVTKYKDEVPFYDLSKNDKNFYCVAYSKDTWIVYGYWEWHECQDWTSLPWEKPFCPNNYITKEEAIAVLLRNSSVYSEEENNLINSQIEEGLITESLWSDVFPFEEDWQVNTFYGYFKQALDYTYQENFVSEEGDIVSSGFNLVELVDWNLYPEKLITNEDYIKMAYVILRTNNCNFEEDKWSFWISILAFDKICSYWSEECSLSDLNDDSNVYDFRGVLDITKPDYYSCSWNFNYLWSQSWEYNWYVYWNYVDNYDFRDTSGILLEWKWSIMYSCQNSSWDSSRATMEMFISSDLNESYWVYSEITPISWFSPLNVSFKGKSLDSTTSYMWYIDNNLFPSRNKDYILNKPWFYPVTLRSTDSEGRTYNAKSIVAVHPEFSESTLASKINIYDSDCSKWLDCELSSIGSSDNVYDVKGVLKWSPSELSDSNYNWKFEYLWSVSWEYKRYYTWEYLDNLSFRNISWDLLEWNWKITLNWTDNLWNSSTSIATINISEDNSNIKNCYISADPIYWVAPLNVNFSAKACNTDNVLWQFGDSESSNLVDLVHQYKEPWIYKVVMKAESWGDIFTDTVVIKVVWNLNITSDDFKINWLPSYLSWDVCLNSFVVNVSSSSWWDKYYWNFWDWSSIKTWREVSHSYTRPWNFVVWLSVYSWSEVYNYSQNIKVWDFNSNYELTQLLEDCNNWPLFVSSEDLDIDWDWVLNINDSCINIPWSEDNQWCPIVEVMCSKNEDCFSWFACYNGLCESDLDGDWVIDSRDLCITTPWVISNNWCPLWVSAWYNSCLSINSSSLIVWTASSCNSCPCQDEVDYISKIRKCDIIFWTVLSADGLWILSKWNNYEVEN